VTATHASDKKGTGSVALKALRRAAKKAIELGRLTRTPAYVLKNGQIVDAAKRTPKTRKIHGKA
jgi:hypothetical protein